MSESCTHNCESCGVDCPSRQPESLIEKPHRLSSIKKVVAVMSGKGGVGKSFVTSLLACELKERGYKVGVLDADVTGPSIPRAFGIEKKAEGTEDGLFPVLSKKGIPVMSINLLLENDTDPVIWRGPIIAGVVKQFWTDVIWGDLDYLLVDMPPGTGDVPLTVFQSIPVDGIIVVSSPQQLVSMIVSKAVNMADMMNIPVLGLVENMSYYTCPDCGKLHKVFGESHIDEIAGKFKVPVLAKLPIDGEAASLPDHGRVEEVSSSRLAPAADAIEQLK